MNYTEKAIKSFFERYLRMSREMIRLYTFWQLYNVARKELGETEVKFLPKEDKELWDRMVSDFESPGYLQLED